MSDKAVRNNPLLPIWSSVPGQGRHRLQSPNTRAAAIRFLRSLPPTPGITMVRRCKTCHRYSTGAPHPDVDHSGSGTGPACSLPHHPDPCDWEDDRGRPCQFQHGTTEDSVDLLGPSAQETTDNDAALVDLPVDHTVVDKSGLDNKSTVCYMALYFRRLFPRDRGMSVTEVRKFNVP